MVAFPAAWDTSVMAGGLGGGVTLDAEEKEKKRHSAEGRGRGNQEFWPCQAAPLASFTWDSDKPLS